MKDKCKDGCTYSRAMNQPYPRSCVHCGVKEAVKLQAAVSDNKWPSPHGHAIASDKTDKMPDTIRGLLDDALDDLQDRGVISHPAPADGLLPDALERVIARSKSYIANNAKRVRSDYLENEQDCITLRHALLNMPKNNIEPLEADKIKALAEIENALGCDAKYTLPKETWETIKRSLIAQPQVAGGDEDLKRECIALRRCTGTDAGIISDTIDYLHANNRLLADGCVGVPRNTEPSINEAMRVLFDAGYKIHGQFGWVTDDRKFGNLSAEQTEKREGE